MPGFLLHAGAVLKCPHPVGVAAIPAPSQQRVLVNGLPVAVATDQILVTGCGQPSPCTAVTWLNISGRVLLSGRPPLLQAPPAGSGNGALVGPPAPAVPIIVTMQNRVTAS